MGELDPLYAKPYEDTSGPEWKQGDPAWKVLGELAVEVIKYIWETRGDTQRYEQRREELHPPYDDAQPPVH